MSTITFETEVSHEVFHDSDVPRFGIWCEVSGGVTGYRCAWLKHDGELAVFADRAAADAEAAHYNASQNAGPYRSANFSYTVKPL